MVKALQEVMRKAETLSDAEQEAIAAIIQAEIEDEAAWQKRFADTSSTIGKLVERAKEQYGRGEYGDFDAK